MEEMIAILNKWVVDGIIKLPEAPKKATEEDKKNPKFCHFHQYIHHSTVDCWTLQRKFHENLGTPSRTAKGTHKSLSQAKR
jgi:hypothetical protein